jgi:aryl-alcohol dehydrogenase-like predicted oxidoreductase
MVEGRALAAQRLSFLVRDGRTPAQAALRFVLGFPEVSVAIPGAKTPSQAAENLAASDAPPLSEDEKSRVRRMYERDFEL